MSRIAAVYPVLPAASLPADRDHRALRRRLPARTRAPRRWSTGCTERVGHDAAPRAADRAVRRAGRLHRRQRRLHRGGASTSAPRRSSGRSSAPGSSRPTSTWSMSTTVTGLAVPSLEARIANRIGLRPDVRRVPLFGLGCLAGAAGLARLHDYAASATRDQVGVLLSVELCSLTLQRDDPSMANLVASGLFGDGAAAVVVVGADRAASPGPTIVDTRVAPLPRHRAGDGLGHRRDRAQGRARRRGARPGHDVPRPTTSRRCSPTTTSSSPTSALGRAPRRAQGARAPSRSARAAGRRASRRPGSRWPRSATCRRPRCCTCCTTRWPTRPGAGTYGRAARDGAGLLRRARAAAVVSRR